MITFVERFKKELFIFLTDTMSENVYIWETSFGDQKFTSIGVNKAKMKK